MASSVVPQPGHTARVQAVRGAAFRLFAAALLKVVGVLEFVVRRGSIGTACIIAGLALIGMVLNDRYGPPPDR